jgi:hypothetical protein
MAVRGTADRVVPVRAAVGRRGLLGQSGRWNKTAAGHHGRFGVYVLVSLMLAGQRMNRNQSQFQRLSTARCPATRLQQRGLIRRQPFVARRDASGWAVGGLFGCVEVVGVLLERVCCSCV